MKKLEKVYKKNQDIVSREIDDELILMPIYKRKKDINEMYTLNETASEMWKLIDGKRSVDDILREMVNTYKASSETIEKDLLEFIKDMKEIKAIE